VSQLVRQDPDERVAQVVVLEPVVMSVRTAIDDRSPCDSNVLTAKSTGKVVPSWRRASPVPTSLGRPLGARASRSSSDRPRIASAE
jgi:hypothetical protein